MKTNINIEIEMGKERIENLLISLSISEVSIRFVLEYLVLTVSHYVSFDNPQNPLPFI